jgi:phosphoglucosamine mutase
MAEATATAPIGEPLQGGQGSFGTDGIRGRVGSAITPALALQVGYWCGRVLPQEGPVLIGSDSRSSGPMLVAALTAGLTAAGREVWSIGLCPTPAVPALIRHSGAAGGLMVSASHNPPHDNGIKVFGASGAKLSRTDQGAIEAGLRGAAGAASLAADGLAQQRHDLLEVYADGLVASVAGSRLEGCRVVLDLCWGSATACGERVFRALGAEPLVLHGSPDGRRINQDCGSTHLEPLRRAVIESLRDQGALPDHRIVATVMSNLGFERAWTDAGGLLERTPVGDQHVHAAMEALGAGLGGEQSGHILSARHGLSGDGLLTALQVATLVHGRGQSLADWMETSFRPYPQKLVNVIVPDRERRTQWQQCEPLRQAVEQAEQAMAGSGRVLVRASGTEPLLRVMVEAAEAEAVEHWASLLAAEAERQLNS